jgi:hypothetical protein
LRLLNETSGAEGLVDAALLHGLDALCGNVDRHLPIELRDENGLLLDVHLLAGLAGRVELGRTRAVRIPACDAGSFAGYDAFTCHSRDTIRYVREKCKE